MGKGGDSLCSQPGLGGMLNTHFDFAYTTPNYLAKISPVTGLDEETWQYLLSAWAGDLSLLSPEAQQALLEAVPSTHNHVFEKEHVKKTCNNCLFLYAL